MKIIVWGINYDLELIGIGFFNMDLCVWLVGCGYVVMMLLMFFYYLWWKKWVEDKGKVYE